ncbi:uncharacterized protein LOC115641522 [Gopherus evgoodei]|uniref:uncharacterized protein LOC115641522 n=1 Tax=Gopherus evgoodei TaxID=1825980 RepID=UPI0011CFDC29|nr:uncharacterized protein LOC115641522 [Gopherus evgoodei]
METMVSGRMPRAGLLLLPFLLCFGPETVGSINPAALREIGNHVNKDGLAVEYAFAVSLQKASCENPSGLEQVLPRNKLQDMQAAINPEGVLYDPDEGPIVAARMKRLGRAGEHAEWRLLQGDWNSPVQKLLARTYNERSCLIFFTIRLPCTGTCLLVKRSHNILRMVSDTFHLIDHNYKAFIFRQIYRQDRDLDSQSLLEAWHRLPDVPLLRCDTNGCKDCRGNDPKTDPNACLDEIRAMRQPLHPPGRGQEGELGGEGRAEDVGESRGPLWSVGEMMSFLGGVVDGAVGGVVDGAVGEGVDGAVGGVGDGGEEGAVEDGGAADAVGDGEVDVGDGGVDVEGGEAEDTTGQLRGTAGQGAPAEDGRAQGTIRRFGGLRDAGGTCSSPD